MKWVKRIIVFLVILLVAVGVAVSFFLGSAIKTAAERLGPDVLGVDVKLDSAKVYPLRGKATLKGLLIGNPEGFKADSMFELGEVAVDMDIKSLMTDRIIINRIYIDAPKITYEQALTGNNIGRLLKGMDSGEAEEEPEEEQPAEKEAPKEGGKKVQINEFVMENARISVALTAVGGKGVTVPMPTLMKEGIGAGEEGTSPAAATREIFAMISQGILDAVKSSGALLGKGVDKAGDLAGAGAEKAGKGVDAVGDAAGKAGQALGTGTGKIKDGIGGLFKKGE